MNVSEARTQGVHKAFQEKRDDTQSKTRENVEVLVLLPSGVFSLFD